MFSKEDFGSMNEIASNAISAARSIKDAPKAVGLGERRQFWLFQALNLAKVVEILLGCDHPHVIRIEAMLMDGNHGSEVR